MVVRANIAIVVFRLIKGKKRKNYILSVRGGVGGGGLVFMGGGRREGVGVQEENGWVGRGL